jgi:hypothetical protein
VSNSFAGITFGTMLALFLETPPPPVRRILDRQ